MRNRPYPVLKCSRRCFDRCLRVTALRAAIERRHDRAAEFIAHLRALPAMPWLVHACWRDAHVLNSSAHAKLIANGLGRLAAPRAGACVSGTMRRSRRLAQQPTRLARGFCAAAGRAHRRAVRSVQAANQCMNAAACMSTSTASPTSGSPRADRREREPSDPPAVPTERLCSRPRRWRARQFATQARHPAQPAAAARVALPPPN